MSKKHKPSKTASSSQKSSKFRKNQKHYLTWLWVGLGIAALVLAAFFLTQPKAVVAAEISPAQAYEQFQQGAYFLDVRSTEEWAQIHIANSTLIPLDELKNRLSELPKDQDIVVICLSGKRSKEGMAVLRQSGFNRAVCLSGGISAWEAAGYPVEGKTP